VKLGEGCVPRRAKEAPARRSELRKTQGAGRVGRRAAEGAPVQCRLLAAVVPIMTRLVPFLSPFAKYAIIIAS
jgi:hypothetical protein